MSRSEICLMFNCLLGSVFNSRGLRIEREGNGEREGGGGGGGVGFTRSGDWREWGRERERKWRRGETAKQVR
jgi:hypothetical protein